MERSCVTLLAKYWQLGDGDGGGKEINCGSMFHVKHQKGMSHNFDSAFNLWDTL